MAIKSIQEEVAKENKRSAKSPAAPKFTNASKLLISDMDHEVWFYSIRDSQQQKTRSLQFVKVYEKTAHIFNGKALIRRFCNVPDGLYTIGLDGGLSPIKAKDYVEGYPDMEDLMKYKICSGWYDFGHADLKIHNLLKCVIPNDEIRRLVGLCSYIRQLERKFSVVLNICFDHDSAHAALNLDSGYRLSDREDDQVRAELKKATLRYKFGLRHPVFLNPTYMEIGLIELLQYPMVALIRDEAVTDSEGFCEKPLVMEYDRGSLFAVAPIRR